MAKFSRPVRQLIVGAVIAVVIGLISGAVALRLDGPFLLGFLSGFVLTGLVTLFVIAVGIENDRISKG